jgi:hypothetical protein
LHEQREAMSQRKWWLAAARCYEKAASSSQEPPPPWKATAKQEIESSDDEYKNIKEEIEEDLQAGEAGEQELQQEGDEETFEELHEDANELVYEEGEQHQEEPGECAEQPEREEGEQHQEEQAAAEGPWRQPRDRTQTIPAWPRKRKSRDTRDESEALSRRMAGILRRGDAKRRVPPGAAINVAVLAKWLDTSPEQVDRIIETSFTQGLPRFKKIGAAVVAAAHARPRGRHGQV